MDTNLINSRNAVIRNTSLLTNNNVDVANGYMTLDESLNEYPKLTIVEYRDSNPTVSIGAFLSMAGLSFFLDSMSIDSAPVLVNGLQKQVTYTYIHVSKRVYEYPVNTKNFVDAHASSSTGETSGNYTFSIGALVGYAQSLAGYGAVSPPGFTFELSKSPSPEDTITIKQFVDDQLLVKGLVQYFSGNGLFFSPLGAGGTVPANVVSNEVVAFSGIPTYKNTILSWSKKDNYDTSILKKQYIEIKDQEYIIYDGDFKAHLPPGEASNPGIFPRDLSIMIDNAAITKSCTITKYKWGEPDIQLSATFGYAHAALELVDDPTNPNTQTNVILDAVSDKAISADNAFQELFTSISTGKYGYPDDANFVRDIVWRLVSIKQTQYIYEPLNPNIKPQLKKADGTLEEVFIPEAFRKYLYSNLQILTKEQSTGWEIKRFATEDPTNWTQGSIQSWLALKSLIDLKDQLVDYSDAESKRVYYWQLYVGKVSLEQYLYRKIPLWEEVRYAIVPYSKYYTDLDEVDWQVQYIPKNVLYNDLTSTDTTTVPVLFPDPNWQPDLMIVSRSRYKSSYGVSGNPQYNPWARNYFGTNPLLVTTGSEEYELTKYSILPSKNTRSNISDLHVSYGDVSEVVAGITAGLDYTGTVYQTAHNYMNIGDYGIKGVPIGKITPNAVLAPYPSNTKNVNDQYTTTTSLRTAQDSSFKRFITTQTFSNADGRPPKATIRKPIYEEIQTEDSPLTNSVTFVTANILNAGIDVQANVSIGGAQNIQQALTGARNKLQLDILTSGSSYSAQLKWTGNIKSLINSSLNVETGIWIIKNVTQSVQFSNNNAFYQPIQVTCGNLVGVGISSRTVQLSNNNNQNSDSVKVVINPVLPSQFGTILENIPDNFSRWIR